MTDQHMATVPYLRTRYISPDRARTQNFRMFCVTGWGDRMVLSPSPRLREDTKQKNKTKKCKRMKTPYSSVQPHRTVSSIYVQKKRVNNHTWQQNCFFLFKGRQPPVGSNPPPQAPSAGAPAPKMPHLPPPSLPHPQNLSRKPCPHHAPPRD